MTLQCYVLPSQPNKEEALWRETLERGIEFFYPQMREGKFAE